MTKQKKTKPTSREYDEAFRAGFEAGLRLEYSRMENKVKKLESENLAASRWFGMVQLIREIVE